MVRIDSQQRLIWIKLIYTYQGDSLVTCLGPPVQFFRYLRRWLYDNFCLDVDELGDCLQHGIQQDSFSCGIVAVNTIAHAVFGKPLWTKQNAAHHRIEWFCLLANYGSEPVVDSAEKVNGGYSAMKPSLSNLLNPAPSFDDSYTHDPTPCPITEDIISSEDDIDSYMPSSPNSGAESDTLQVTPNVVQEPRINPQQPLPKRAFRYDTQPDNSGGSDLDYDSDQERVYKKMKDGTGLSRSAQASRENRESIKARTFVPNPSRMRAWQQKILKKDPNAVFDHNDPRRVRHSHCAQFIRVKEAYDTTRFNAHVATCGQTGRLPKGAGSKSLLAMGWLQSKKEPSNNHIPDTPRPQDALTLAKPPLSLPCPGLTKLDDARILDYLCRTAAVGGGGRSWNLIAKERYTKNFSKLMSKQRKVVLDLQRLEHKWQNDHMHQRVYSANCESHVPSRIHNRSLPCSSCCQVLQLRSFKNVIRKPVPKVQNQIFTNKMWQNPLLGKLYGRHIGLVEIMDVTKVTT